MNTLDYILRINGIKIGKTAKMPIEIPNVTRLDMLRWIRKLDFQTAVEVGVAEGEYSKLLCETNPQMKIYGIDPYKAYRGYFDYTRDDTFKILLDQAQRRLSSFIKKRSYVMIKEFSADSIERFKDNSLDFVYIDANHREPFVSQDINGWYKKVRPGGILSGHDYTVSRHVVFDVISAVKKFTSENRIIPWFVLGTWERTPGIKRDESRSWMIVKLL